jgi:hypothetical protein
MYMMFNVYRGLRTGEIRVTYFIIDRKETPALFWLGVAMSVALVLGCPLLAIFAP